MENKRGLLNGDHRDNQTPSNETPSQEGIDRDRRTFRRLFLQQDPMSSSEHSMMSLLTYLAYTQKLSNTATGVRLLTDLKNYISGTVNSALADGFLVASTIAHQRKTIKDLQEELEYHKQFEKTLANISFLANLMAYTYQLALSNANPICQNGGGANVVNANPKAESYSDHIPSNNIQVADEGTLRADDEDKTKNNN